ncbi:MAG: zinc-ribbon domain-containing protein [Geobacteraceae bacterium]
MIIQCEKCKTRFKLDDSRVTDSGIRVRCSRCSHTFVVRRESPEDEPDFESILQGFGGSEPADEDEETNSLVDGFSEGKDIEEDDVSGDEEFEGDESLSDGSLTESGLVADSLSAAGDDQAFESSSAEFEKGEVQECAEPEQTEKEETTFSEVLRKGVGLPHFQSSPGFDSAANDLAAKSGEVASGLESLFDDGHLQDTVNESGSSSDDDLIDSPAAATSAKEIEKPVLSIRERIWPMADSKDDESLDADLSPLSISSRRKGSPLLPILLGILSVLLLGGTGYYLVSTHGGPLADILPESAKGMLGLGKRPGGLVEIRSLDGAFLSNRDAGEIFVMKGDAFNVSSAPLRTIQVRGKIFGPNGEILLQQTVFCGNVLTGEQLAMQPYSSMVKEMGKQFGATLANFEVQPGKGVPFVIVFKGVPKGAKDFGAEVVSPVAMNAH